MAVMVTLKVMIMVMVMVVPFVGVDKRDQDAYIRHLFQESKY